MPSDPASEELDGCDEQPSGGGRDGLFEVLDEAAVAVEPSQGSLDDPPAGQDLEAFCSI